jgi:plastocyanin
MHTPGAPMTRLGRRAVLALGILLTVAACGGGGGSGGALGYDTAPASLDPASPKLVAENIAFDAKQLAVPANTPFAVVFENRDTVPHNVSVYTTGAGEQRVFQGVIVTGPATRWYPVPALAPGTYAFRCDIHPTMTGTIVAS